MTISEAEFTANIANPESVYGYGGGLFIDKRRENRGPDGRIIPFKDINILIDLSNFTENIAYEGGALLFGSCAGVVRRSRFLRNQASAGGADIRSEYRGSEVTDIKKVTEISLSYFEFGGSATVGAAIYIDLLGKYEDIDNLDEDGHPTVSFENSNNTKFMGGAAKIDQCTFVGSSLQNVEQGGAIYLRNDRYLELTSCTFRTTAATKGGALYA